MNAKPEFLLGLVGYPLSHSLSPLIHQAALESLGLGGDYQLYPIPPLPAGEEDLDALLQRVRSGELHGLNVTIPHKQAVLPRMHSLSTSARDTGAVNTIYAAGGLLVGDNTDIAGFQRDLSDQLPPGKAAGQALVLGAGGSARAVIYALSRSGWQVNIAARRVSQAQQLVESLLGSAVRSSSANGHFDLQWKKMAVLELSVNGLEGFLNRLTDHDSLALVVNTTPVGMAPEGDASPWPEEIPFPRQAFVYDLVYNPSETRLIRAARQSGLKAANGLGMLVEQAALSFESWTGFPAPRGAMAESVMLVRRNAASS